MDGESSTQNLDDWSLDNDEQFVLHSEDQRATNQISYFDSGRSIDNKTTEYLEISDDEDSVVEGALGGIDTVGLTADDYTESEAVSVSEASQLDRNPWDGLPYSSQYYDLLALREKLVVWQAKDDFILSLDESSIVLVTGRAGTGKSTQIPQWCAHYAKELGFECGTVVCTQPHSLAAASLALQVSREMDLTTSIGNEVGYKIPFSNMTSDDTILKFCTDKVLLQEMAEDPYLERYGIIVVDEVQERTVSTDILLSLLKVIVCRRETIKIVVISLPHEMPKLEEYFEGVPVVDLSYVEESLNNSGKIAMTNLPHSPSTLRRSKLHFKRLNELHCDYVSDAVETVLKCHCDQTLDGNILVFMPGEKDINEVCERVAREAAMRVLRGEAGDLVTVPLFSTMPYGKQQACYENSPANMESLESGLHSRRLIICDKMVESSFSMDNIAFVVDSGREILKAYDCRTRSRSDILRYTTRRSADLRYKRCKESGHVYRLYTKAEYQKFPEFLPPALSRSELSTDVLLTKRLLQQLDEKFSSCQTIDPPAPDAYMQALEDLDYHGALDESGDLSDLGAVMSEFPVSLPLSKSLVASCGEQCTEEMLTIASMLATSSCFLHENDTSSSISSSRRKLNHPAGDHFTLLHIYEAFVASSQSEYWCKENGFRYESLKFACKIRDELVSVMSRLELPMSDKIMNEDLLTNSIKKALLAGFFMQVAKDVDGSGNYLIARDRHVSRLRKSTSLQGHPDWVLYHDFVLSDTNSIVTVTAVSAEMIAEISPSSYLANLPNGEAKDSLLKAASKVASRTISNSLGHNGKEEDVTDTSSAADQIAGSSIASVSESHPPIGGPSSKSLTHLERSNNSDRSSQNDSITRETITRSRPIPEDNAYPVGDLLTATARELGHAYRQASDYVRNYTVEDENNQEGCVIQ